MNDKAKEKWNNIYSDKNVAGQSATQVITENAHLLPSQGVALDLACGTGADAIFFAQRGLNVDAWDISNTIIDKLSEYANKQGLAITAQARDIGSHPPEAERYDVISVAHFLDRDLMPVLMRSLRPGGLLFYQTFSHQVTDDYSGPKNPAFRLGDNELLRLFSDLKLVVYREERLVGDLQKGFRNEVMFIGQK